MRSLIWILAVTPALAQVTIRVDATQTVGAFKPIYGYFGYDEPNYTYTKNGKKLIGELAGVSSGHVYIRTHFSCWQRETVRRG